MSTWLLGVLGRVGEGRGHRRPPISQALQIPAEWNVVHVRWKLIGSDVGLEKNRKQAKNKKFLNESFKNLLLNQLIKFHQK